jgi:hypothetical protein
MLDRTRKLLLFLALLAVAPAIAAADPSLRIEAFRETTPGKLVHFLRTASWWIEVHAAADGTANGAPLTRLEYWAQGLEGSRRIAGEIALAGSPRMLAGKVKIRFPTNADRTERLKVRLRVHASDGATSAWQTVVFPDDARLGGGDDAPPTPTTAAARPAAAMTVEVLADDTQSLAEVRRALDREARARGGRVVGEPRILGTEEGMTRFAADVQIDAPAPPPTPTLAPQPVYDVVIGEIFIPDEPLR